MSIAIPFSPRRILGVFLAKFCDQKCLSLRLRGRGDPTIVLSDWLFGLRVLLAPYRLLGVVAL